MAEIIHQIAPSAHIIFYSGEPSGNQSFESGMATAITALSRAGELAGGYGCNIVCDDIFNVRQSRTTNREIKSTARSTPPPRAASPISPWLATPVRTRFTPRTPPAALPSVPARLHRSDLCRLQFRHDQHAERVRTGQRSPAIAKQRPPMGAAVAIDQRRQQHQIFSQLPDFSGQRHSRQPPRLCRRRALGRA